MTRGKRNSRPVDSASRAVAAHSPLAGLDARALYEVCAERVAREISVGTLRPGQRLPSERALAEALGYTRLTARRALKLLGERGLIEPDDRRGWQVRGGPVSEPLSTLIGFTQMARQRGLIATSKILSLSEREATIDEADALRVAAGSALLDLSRLRMLDDRPTALERLRMPTSRVRWPAGFDFTSSIYEAWESQGIVPTRADAIVDVVDANVEAAELLGVTVGRGLLHMSCVTISGTGSIICLEDTRYHPDRYRFRATLERRLA